MVRGQRLECDVLIELQDRIEGDVNKCAWCGGEQGKFGRRR
jgi:hypothetical protein